MPANRRRPKRRWVSQMESKYRFDRDQKVVQAFALLLPHETFDRTQGGHSHEQRNSVVRTSVEQQASAG
jgi:hypothetical protein